MSQSHNEFFDEIQALVPWLTGKETRDALAEVEIQFFKKHPEELRMEEMLSMPYEEVKKVEERQNMLIFEAFRNSRWMRRV